ncbi:MAG: phosphatase [Candidatus Choladocola sp.]|nr:phosphatase [Candidatus Choladocola sp.]
MKYVLDSHTHTIASGHAYNTVYEMVKAAADQGLELLGITEHCMKMPGTCHEYYFMNLRMLPRVQCGIEVMFGVEANIMDYDGTVDMDQSLLEKMDVVIASMHTPCLRPGTREENTRAFLKVMENPAVNIIGHPDDARYPIDYEALVLGAKEHHVLLELNNGSLHPLGARQDPLPNDIRMLELCRRYDVPIILDSDAHCASDVGNHQFTDVLLEEMDFPEELIVNRSVEEYKKYINRFKKG